MSLVIDGLKCLNTKQEKAVLLSFWVFVLCFSLNEKLQNSILASRNHDMTFSNSAMVST